MKNFKRIAALVGVMMFLWSGQAGAASYGFNFVLNGALSPGGSTQVHVEGFAPGAKVTILLVSPGKTAALVEPAALRASPVRKAELAEPAALLASTGYQAVLAETVADSEGVVDVIVKVPADAPSGLYAITVSGAAAAGGTKTESFSIKIGLSQAGGPLPTTGSSPMSLLSLAAGMVVLGATGVLATRLRHRTDKLAA